MSKLLWFDPNTLNAKYPQTKVGNTDVMYLDHICLMGMTLQFFRKHHHSLVLACGFCAPTVV